MYNEIINNRSENRIYDLKREFHSTEYHWVELVKDIVSFGNIGLGYLIFGIDNNKIPVGLSVETKSSLIDSSEIKKKLRKFTRSELEIEVILDKEGDLEILIIKILNKIGNMVVFDNDGEYSKESKVKDRLFSKGQIFIRGDGCNELLSSDNEGRLRHVLMINERQRILDGITKVIENPVGYKLVSISDNGAPVRIDQDSKNAASLKIDVHSLGEIYKRHPEYTRILMAVYCDSHTSISVSDLCLYYQSQYHEPSMKIDKIDLFCVAAKCPEFPRFIFIDYKFNQTAVDRMIEWIPSKCNGIDEIISLLATLYILDPGACIPIISKMGPEDKKRINSYLGKRFEKIDDYFCAHYNRGRKVVDSEYIDSLIRDFTAYKSLLVEEKRKLFSCDYENMIQGAVLGKLN